MSEGEYLRHKGTLCTLFAYIISLFYIFCNDIYHKFVDLVSVLCIYNFFIASAQLEPTVFVHIITACVLRPVMLW
mgnify:CR=1 FL=1